MGAGRIMKTSSLCSRLPGGPGINLFGLIFCTYKMEGLAQMIRNVQRFLNSALRGNQRVGQSWVGGTEELRFVSDMWRWSSDMSRKRPPGGKWERPAAGPRGQAGWRLSSQGWGARASVEGMGVNQSAAGECGGPERMASSDLL